MTLSDPSLNQNSLIEILSLTFTFITTVFVVYITLLALKHTAKPKMKIVYNKLKGNYSTNTEYLISFSLYNLGNWYGKPGIKHLECFVNFLPPTELVEIRYGSIQELKNMEVKIGKGGSKYLKAEGIYLIHGEPPENIEVKIKTPNDAGEYKFWIACYSEDGISQKFDFILPVEKK